MEMALVGPEWLTRHGGSLKPGNDGKAYLVYVNGEAQYIVMPVPADGKYACQVVQTINGKRLDDAKVYETLDQAATGGLEALRAALGW
jgi:hypothetical protein